MPLPAHVGRDLEPETGYALVCGCTPDGDPNTDAICGQTATHHIKWNPEGENGFTCDEHHPAAAAFNPVDVHSTHLSACGMPGAIWVDSKPSRCTMLALDEEPDRSGHVHLSLTAAAPGGPGRGETDEQAGGAA